MLIRPATPSDEKSIIQLMDEFNDYYSAEHIFTPDFLPFWDYKDKQAIFTETAHEWLNNPKYLFFVAEESGKVVGYICGKVRERTPRVLDKEGYINGWFVQKDWRRKGVGMKLYEPLVEEFKKRSCNRLGLLTNTRNQRTIDFYHQLGFIDESLTLVKRV